MNAAEITDKLGLHSLRQRAWVRHDGTAASESWLIQCFFSTSNLLAPHLVTVSTKDLNG